MKQLLIWRLRPVISSSILLKQINNNPVSLVKSSPASSPKTPVRETWELRGMQSSALHAGSGCWPWVFECSERSCSCLACLLARACSLFSLVSLHSSWGLAGTCLYSGGHLWPTCLRSCCSGWPWWVTLTQLCLRGPGRTFPSQPWSAQPPWSCLWTPPWDGFSGLPRTPWTGGSACKQPG